MKLHPTSIYYPRRRAGGVSGMAGRAVANTLNINGVRYGMAYTMSHYASAARLAWMPVGKSTLCRKAYRA